MITKLKRGINLITWITMVAICLVPSGIMAEEAEKVKRTAEKTVEIDSRTQEAVEAWVAEERRLMAEIEKVEAALQHTLWRQQKAITYRETLDKKVRELKQRAAEMETINLELLPVLDQTIERLRTFVEADLPYEQAGRRKRLLQAERILNDYDPGLLVKARAVFDTVAREVDIGYSVGVQDAEISVDEQPKTVKLLRVGRVGLYALTLDTQEAYVWDREQKEFHPLKDGVRAIEEAVQIAEGVRISKLIRLPMGRPVKEENTRGDIIETE